MRYIKLSNTSYILYLSDGVRTLTFKAFNFYKIKKLVKAGATEEEIRPLLKIPSLPNGVYEAYILPTNIMVYLHIKPSGDCYWKKLDSKQPPSINKEELDIDSCFAGIYASLEDLQEDWPEFLF